jgi:hypothetical protein
MLDLTIFDKININLIKNLSDNDLNKIYNKQTPIEYCLDLYISHSNKILKNNLEQIILYLNTRKSIRPCYLYATLIKLNIINPTLYSYLSNDKSMHIDTYSMIDDYMIAMYIDTDNIIILEYLKTVNISITIDLINKIVNKKCTNIINSLIKANINVYHIVSISDNMDLITIDHLLLFNYLELILEFGSSRAFYYLYEYNNSILDTIFEDNMNILFKIKPKNNYIELIQIILKLAPELLNDCDTFGNTPILYHARNNPEILLVLLKSNVSFELTCNNIKNNIFHEYLLGNAIEQTHIVLSILLNRYTDLINKTNILNETPLLIAAKNNYENIFTTLFNYNKDIISDTDGNTIYHYICKNNMCLGMTIDNSYVNLQGLKPIDYCKIDISYYCFIN